MSLIVFLSGFRSSATLILPFFENSQWWLDPDYSPLATLCSCAFKIQLFCLFFYFSLLPFFIPWRAVADAVSSYSFGLISPHMNWLRWSSLGPRAKTQPAGVAMWHQWIFVERLLPASFSSRVAALCFSLQSNWAGWLCLGVGTRDTTQKRTIEEGKQGKCTPPHHQNHHHLTRQFGRGWRCQPSSKNKDSA